MEEKQAVRAPGEMPAADKDDNIRQRAVDNQSELQSFVLFTRRFIEDVALPYLGIQGLRHHCRRLLCAVCFDALPGST